MSELRKEIDCNFQWTFHKSSGVFKTQKEFVDAVNKHLDETNKEGMPNIQIQEDGHHSWNPGIDGYKERDEEDKITWDPEEVVIPRPVAKIVRKVVHFADSSRYSKYEFKKELIATINADNKESITMGELMFKLHKIMCKKKLGDHVFPEMFVLLNEEGGIPTYELYLGS